MCCGYDSEARLCRTARGERVVSFGPCWRSRRAKVNPAQMPKRRREMKKAEVWGSLSPGANRDVQGSSHVRSPTPATLQGLQRWCLDGRTATPEGGRALPAHCAYFGDVQHHLPAVHTPWRHTRTCPSCRLS